VARLWWKSLDEFAADARRAGDERLREMQDWARAHELSSDSKGSGRNPKARRMYRQMREAADAELDRRGLFRH
jgi:hypothetical protein